MDFKEGRSKAEQFVAGYANVIEALRQVIIYPFVYNKEAQKLGLKWPKGLLLHGPPGTGKTSLVHAVVRECNAHLTTISPHSILSPYAGESERLLREAFSEASSHASLGRPSVVFIDEIDALCPQRDSRREEESRITAQLLCLMSGRKASVKYPHVAVVASTNRVRTVDSALRRFGRFDVEIEVAPPNEEERLKILELYSKDLILDKSIDLKALAVSCNGYVGADLEALCRAARMSAMHKKSSTLEKDHVVVTIDDWSYGRTKVGPSIMRGISVKVPRVSWEDIGGLNELKKELRQAVEWPMKHSSAFERMGISPVRGVLLHGPPGCSKTTLAMAAAHAAEVPFFLLSCADFYSKFVGEGEALLRSIFQRARAAAPSIIFFDEFDIVGGKRGGGESSHESCVVGERLMSTLLTEMDGLEQTKGILVLAATNRPAAIDAALMRPGRFDLVLYVPPPDVDGREEILRVHTRSMNLGEDVNLRRLAEDTDLFTGAELERLCAEACIAAIREEGMSLSVMHDCHFWTARNFLKPALDESQIEAYTSFMRKNVR